MTIRFVQGSSYDPVLILDAHDPDTGKPIRLRTAIHARCSKPLAPIENAGCLNLDALRHLPELGPLFALWDAPFEHLLTRKLPQNPSRVISRTFLPSDLPELAKITVAATPGETRCIARWFKVPKKDQESSRLVQNLSALSESMISPPVPFARLHDLMARILAAPAVMLADFKNWFYQFRIPVAWRPWFGALIASRRGQLQALLLIVLSMGLGISTFVAQCVAKAIASLAVTLDSPHDVNICDSDAWVDNLIWMSSTAELLRVMAALERLRPTLRFVWSEPPTIHTDTFDFLGLEFNLPSQSARPSTALREKMTANIAKITEDPSTRTALAVVGLLLWVNWAIARYPLAFFEAILGWLSSTVPDIRRLDDTAHIPPHVVQSIIDLTERTVVASISREELQAPFASDLSLFSDASNTALAAVHYSGTSRPTVHVWQADCNMTIFAREALAFLLGVMSIPRPPPTIGAGLDNMNWLCALHKGHSSNTMINMFLRAYYRYANRHGFRLSTVFLPSSKQLADFPSRHLPLPSNWRDFLDPPTPLRPLPVFRVPRDLPLQ